MRNLKCPCCGAPLKNDDTYCPYCGSYLTNDKEKSHKGFESISDGVSKTFQELKETTNNITGVKKNFNWLLFIILIFAFFPAAIIYFIANLDFKNK